MKTVDLRRRKLAGALGAAMIAGPWAVAHAQTYPSKPVRIVHGFDAGSTPDTVARLIGPALTERLGQPIIVESRPGAAGRIATAYVAAQEPDGHTLMMLTAGDTVGAATLSNLPYDLEKDFAFISTVMQFPFMVLVSADSPLKSLDELIGAAKRSPGKLTYATSGVRTTMHLGMELIKAIAGVDILHVPFKGNPFNEIIAGRIDLIMSAAGISTPQVKSGKLRALAVTGSKRMDAFRDVPTVGETLSSYEVTSWNGLAAPAKTGAAIVEKLSADVRQVLLREEIRSRLLAIGNEPTGSTPREFRGRVESEIRKWKTLVANVRLDN